MVRVEVFSIVRVEVALLILYFSFYDREIMKKTNSYKTSVQKDDDFEDEEYEGKFEPA